MSKEAKRILVTLRCEKCGRNLERDSLIHLRPNGVALCEGTCAK